VNQNPIKIGVVGLGRAFTLMLGTFQLDPRIELVGAADTSSVARSQFSNTFGLKAHEDVEKLCQQKDVELVYVASPHQHHAAHVQVALKMGKHVMVEKPMAISLQECTDMIECARRHDRHLIVGHSHSFDAPVRMAKEIIDQGKYGKIKMITAMNYTDFLYRPRRPEELITRAGGGVIHSQAAHHIDIIRLLAGGKVTQIQAQTGQWDPQRPTEGAYSALLRFENNSFASVTYSGYGHFDSDIWMDNISELGQRKSTYLYGEARKKINKINPQEESELKATKNQQNTIEELAKNKLPDGNQHFGPIIVSCEGADLQLTPNGIWIHSDEDQIFHKTPVNPIPRAEVIDELWDCLRLNKNGIHTGPWARATTEVCLGILEAARTSQTFYPVMQVGL